MENLNQATTDQLKQELEKRGFCTSSLWHIDDISNCIKEHNQENEEEKQIENTNEICVKALDDLFGIKADKSTDFEMIKIYLSNL